MKTKSILSHVEIARKAMYYSTIVLDKDRKDDFQFLMASQLYGTFFGIYGRFEVDKRGSKSLVKKIVFRIINYKGIINLGIVEVSQKMKKPRSKKFDLVITLKGLMPLFQDYTYVPAGIEEMLLDASNEISLKREVTKLSADLHEVMTDGVFDDEFYFKDGLFPIDAPNSELEDRIGDEFPTIQEIGRRCPFALVKIICNT